MKKFILSCSIVLLGLGLSGCDNQNIKKINKVKLNLEKLAVQKEVLVLSSPVH